METLEIHQTPKPSDSVDFHQTLGVSSPYSPSPNQILDDPSESTSVPAELSLDDFTNQISPSPNRSVSVLFIDDEDEGEGDEGDDGPSVNSPVNTFSAFSSSHWAEPWSLPGDRKTKPAEPESETELWSLAVDTSKPYEFNWSDDWTWCDETESKRSMVVAGLSNLGNTCFLNAILQCFTHTVQLIQGLLSCNHVPCDRYCDGFCILCAFRDHIEVAPTTGIVYPRRFVENLNYFSSGFRRFQQEDAHEFLQCFLDRLENCCNGLKTKDTTSSSQDDNFVKKGFGGRLVSKLRCCNCYHCSNTYEPSIDLSLEIEDVSTLQSALESFTKVEKLEDTDIKFTCENCNEEVSVEKQLMLEEAPLVAALHLKRFKNDGAFVEKIDKDVEFPLELDLGPYTCGSLSDDVKIYSTISLITRVKLFHPEQGAMEELPTYKVELKYDLYAVVVHIGYSSTSGHYYCFIRYAPDTWYKFDDSKVTRVREDYVLSQEAYILFYAKQGTPWFSNFLMETQNPSFEPNTSNTSPKSVLDNADRVSTSSSNLPDNHNSCDVDQTSDASNEISREAFKGSRPDRFEGIEAKDDSQRIIGPLPLRESNSFYGTSFKVEKMFSPSNREFGEAKDNSNFTLLTPPRSPSPDIPEEDPAEVGFYNTRNRVRSVDQVNSKRQANKEMDPERKQACKLLKTLPGSRSSQLLAAMRGSLSEGSVNKTKSRRSELSPRTADNSPSSARKNPKFSFIPRPLTASSFR